MHKQDLLAFGYREMKRAGFSWLANEGGLRLLSAVEDWSPQVLAGRKGWTCREKRDHLVYVARDAGGRWYLIKDYPPEKSRRRLFRGESNRAKRECFKTLLAHKKGIPTVLPLAVGEFEKDLRHGVIVYPFLDQAIPLERVYDPASARTLTIPERQALEKAVGRLMRTMHDAGAYPIDAHLDHFLVSRADNGEVEVRYIDFERIKFHGRLTKWLGRRRLLKSLGRLLARFEWLRVSGGAVNRPCVMRMSLAFLKDKASDPKKRRLRRAVIQAAAEFWQRRDFARRGAYGFRSFESVRKTASSAD